MQICIRKNLVCIPVSCCPCRALHLMAALCLGENCNYMPQEVPCALPKVPVHCGAACVVRVAGAVRSSLPVWSSHCSHVWNQAAGTSPFLPELVKSNLEMSELQ